MVVFLNFLGPWSPRNPGPELSPMSYFKSTFSSEYILNLISQTNIQMGDLASGLDNLLGAEKKWKKVLIYIIKYGKEKKSEFQSLKTFYDRLTN